MKVMDKATIIQESMIESVLHERYMMAKLSSPLVVNLQFATQNELDLFLIVDLMLGGDLRYHMKSGRSFDPERVRFYAAQTALGINFLHESGYIHRDIKPDNLLLDGDGNVHITDFNLSIRKDDPRRRGVVGTRSYMAPEVVSRQAYDEAVDWWSLGICLYEWSYGTVPFRGSTEEQRQAILRADPRYPSGVDKRCKSFIMGLLRKDPKKRLNWKKIQDHSYFEGMDWKALREKRIEAPWKPDTTRANCDGTFDLDEQFQVKKKRPPVLDEVFGAWDWKPGQDDDSLSEGQSTESDGAISDERLTPRTGTEDDDGISSSDDSGTAAANGSLDATSSSRALNINNAAASGTPPTNAKNTNNTHSASRTASPVPSRHTTTEDIPSPDALAAGDDKRSSSKKQLKQQQQTAVVVEHPIGDVPQGHTSTHSSPQQPRKKKSRGSAPAASTEDTPNSKPSSAKTADTDTPTSGRSSSRDLVKTTPKDSERNSGPRPKSKKKQRDTS